MHSIRSSKKALVMDDRDNVATVLSDIQAGTMITVEVGGKTVKLVIDELIPFGHKFATKDIQNGEAVYKYGETIGKATEPIKAGQHVHTHNVESVRGKQTQQK